MNSSSELAEALAPVIAAFEQLQISHCIGGSIASSFHGAARATTAVLVGFPGQDYDPDSHPTCS